MSLTVTVATSAAVWRARGALERGHFQDQRGAPKPSLFANTNEMAPSSEALRRRLPTLSVLESAAGLQLART